MCRRATSSVEPEEVTGSVHCRLRTYGTECRTAGPPGIGPSDYGPLWRPDMRAVRRSQVVAHPCGFLGSRDEVTGPAAAGATPWAGDPRVNIQENHGMAKPYQVRQVLAAIRKLEEEDS